jgi:hypothetical protein
MAHHDPVRPTDHGEILRRARQLRQQVAEETQRVAVTITATKGLRETLVELAERVAAVHDDRSSLCDRLAGHHLFPRHYWPSQAARARRIAALNARSPATTGAARPHRLGSTTPLSRTFRGSRPSQRRPEVIPSGMIRRTGGDQADGTADLTSVNEGVRDAR